MAQVYLALVAVPCRVSSLVLSPVPTKPAAATESGIGFTVLASHGKMKGAERGRVAIMGLLHQILGKQELKLFQWLSS